MNGCIILLYTHLAHSKCIKKVATFFYQGSHTGQEVIFDLFFCFPTFENLTELVKKRIGVVNEMVATLRLFSLLWLNLLLYTWIYAQIILFFVQNIDMQTLISDNLDKIGALCQAYNVKSLFAFGSVCTDKFNEKSDIDLLVSFNQMAFGDYADSYFELADQFEHLFNRPVDLVTDKSLSNPYFITSVNQTKTLLYWSWSKKNSFWHQRIDQVNWRISWR